MAKKINPKDKDFVNKLSENLEGVGFSGSEELESAVEEVIDTTPSPFEKFINGFKKVLGLPVGSQKKENDKS